MSSGKRTCLKGGALWQGAGAPLTEGGLLVTDSRITAVLNPGEAEDAAGGADEVIDVAGMLLMPPLFDAHVHSSSSLLRGTENSLPLELWSYYAINFGRGFGEEALRCAVQLTDLEMIRNGIGGFIDHFPQSHRASHALAAHRQSGLRIGFAPFFADMWDEDILAMPLDRKIVAKIAPLAPKRIEDVRATFVDLAHEMRHAGDGRISLLAGPNSPQRCSDSLWALWRELQDELGIGSHTHLLETFPQAQAARSRWPNGVVRALDAAGLLHDRLSIAHGIWLDADEREILAARGVSVSYNPVSNGMLGSGRKNVRVDLDAGLKILLGTDSSNTGGRHDLFEIMRHMLMSDRDAGSDFDTWITPAEVLAAATTTGARAVGGPGVTGVLEAGAVADILVVDIGAAGMAASMRSLSSIVVHGDPRNVHSLMIDGDWLLRAGKVLSLDEDSILADAARHAEDLRAAARERHDDIVSLHGSYAAWQMEVYATAHCPACSRGATPAPATGRRKAIL